MRRCALIVLLLCPCFSLSAQALLHLLHPQPRAAYQRVYFSAVYVPTAGQHIFLDPARPAHQQAAEINAFLRSKGNDTLLIALWTPADTLESGMYLGIASEFLNTMLAAFPDQRIRVTPTYPGPEGYVLDAVPMRVLINASDEAGLRYGVHTLKQLLLPFAGWWGLEACRIVDAPEFPRRWMYHSTNVLVGANVTAAKALWDNAVAHRINGVQLNDSKFSRPTTLPQRYLDSLASLKRYADDRGLELIPGVMPIGYSNEVLFHNPNLASGLPVRSQRFVIEADSARLLPHVQVALPNGGFEQRNGDQFPGFRFIDQPGQLSFADTDIKHSGSTSIRFENFAQYSPQSGNGRVSYWTRVQPFTQYHVRGWVRTEALQPASSMNISVLSNAGYQLAFNDFSIPSSTDWIPIDFTFNSLEADTVGVYWGVWGARSGKIWWDDLLLEEAAFVNLLRREGTPLTVTHPTLRLAYIEGVDFDTLRDARMGNHSWPGDYDRWHTPPTFKRLPAGALANGDTILVSWYHAIVIYTDQVMATMSDPELYTILDREFRVLDSVLAPRTVMMQHDEIRTMNWDAGDENRGMTPAQLLADNVRQCRDIIRRHNPDADVWVWSDMFDEYHNAVKGPYYLVRGDLRGSADLIEKSIGMVNWNGRDGTVQNSLGLFATKGFRQMSAPYYDQDEQQIRRWREWTRDTEHFHGMMYTTWSRKYDHLEAFGDYAWNHAPYIQHLPPMTLRAGETLDFPLRVHGDRWDPAWELESVTLHYRYHPGDDFTMHTASIATEMHENIPIDVPADAAWMQWFITASDNRGWTSRVPLGDTVYYELGSLVSAIGAGTPPSALWLSAAPNPVRTGGSVHVDYLVPAGQEATLELFDVLGRPLSMIPCAIGDGRLSTLKLDTQALPAGMYVLRLRNATSALARTFIVQH